MKSKRVKDLTGKVFGRITVIKQAGWYYPPKGGGRKANGGYTYNGIDRVDNTKGYEETNVVPCCTVCNRAKMAHTQEEFFDRVRRIYEKHLRSE